MTVEQIKGANDWQHAIYDEDFRKKLDLLPLPAEPENLCKKLIERLSIKKP